MDALKKILIITRSTLYDELHHKSVYLLSAVAVLFVLTLRGCFDDTITMNGRQLDGATVGWHASLAAFHLIAGAGILMGILLGMRVLGRDKTTGTSAAVLAKPVHRFIYIIGKALGIWITAYGLTFILHVTVYVIMLVKTGGRIELFLPASLLLSVNVLFAVVSVMLLSQLLPDIAAALISVGIWLVGYISDTVYLASQTEMVKNVLEQMQRSGDSIALWRILWPKMTALQFFGVSLIKDTPFHAPGPVHPFFNVAAYTGAMLVLLWRHFSREEIR